MNQGQEGEPGKTDDETTQDSAHDNAQDNESEEGDLRDEVRKGDESTAEDHVPAQPVEMTPEIDAGFAQIARERIARHPFRYFLLLPVKRALSLWFDTHSQYYPFEGELLPLGDLDHDIHQQVWLPLFAGLTFFYTLLGIAGGLALWQTRDFMSRQWLLLASLMIFLRLGFFSTLENPEPRYVVELFPFLSILGGIALTRILIQISTKLKVASQKK